MMRIDRLAGVLAGVVPLIVGCAPAAPAPSPAPVPAGDPAAIRWVIVTRPHVDLWYHGLALTAAGGAAPLPLYERGYRERVNQAKQAAGTGPTPLDQRADDLERQFAADARYAALQFLPLYFSTGEALFTAVRAWVQVEGDPRRVQDPGLAQAVAFLSQQLPTAAQRRTVGGFADLLEEEERRFFGRYRAERGAALGGVAAAVQARWDPLGERLRPYLDYAFLNQGELILSFPLGPEGRTLDVGRQNNRSAVGVPDANDPASLVWAFVKELMYPLVGPVIADHLAPAQRRELDERRVSAAAAVRAGALLLDRLSPQDAAEYRAAALRWVGAGVPASGAARDAAFVQSFTLPEPLPRAIADAIDAAVQGI